jgi:hypothetical protein
MIPINKQNLILIIIKENCMAGSLNDILAESISKENEKIIEEFIKRKITTAAGVAVDLMHEMERNFGPRVREIVKEMAQHQEFPPRDKFGTPEQDLKDFCENVDHTAAGSHRWEKVTNEPNQIGYHFTRCMFAEVFRALGEPDLGLILCATDKPKVEAYNPKLKFQRTKVLMNGDEICDHLYFIEK